jgi:DNA topoisomerase IA
MADLKAAALTLWGWAPAKTAGVAYALYNKGLISYPSDNTTTLPVSLAATVGDTFANLRHHPVLGKKASSVSVTGTESVWSGDTEADALHAVTVTGLYPVDLSREEEMLYIVVADHILDVFSPEKS